MGQSVSVSLGFRKMGLQVLTVCVALVVAAKGQSQLKPKLEECIGDGLSLSSCLTAMAKVNLGEFMKSGLPDLGGKQVVDPMNIEDITELLETPLGNLEVNFRNIQVSKLSDHEVEKVAVDVNNKKIVIQLSIPFSKSVGQYKMKGTIGPLDLSEYDTWEKYVTDFSNTDTTVTADIVVDAENRIISVGSPVVNTNIKGIKPTLDNLFNGEADAFAKVVTKFLGKQGHDFITKFQPRISEIISEFFETILTNVLSGVELKE